MCTEESGGEHGGDGRLRFVTQRKVGEFGWERTTRWKKRRKEDTQIFYFPAYDASVYFPAYGMGEMGDQSLRRPFRQQEEGGYPNLLLPKSSALVCNPTQIFYFLAFIADLLGSSCPVHPRWPFSVENICFPGNLEFLPLPPQPTEKSLDYSSSFAACCSSGGDHVFGEGDLLGPPFGSFGEVIREDEESEEEIEVDELERQMWRDRMRLRRLKERQQTETTMTGVIWQAQEEGLREICGLLEQQISPDSDQQLVFNLAHAEGKQVVIRQAAGLLQQAAGILLKNNLRTNSRSMSTSHQHYAKSVAVLFWVTLFFFNQ